MDGTMYDNSYSPVIEIQEDRSHNTLQGCCGIFYWSATEKIIIVTDFRLHDYMEEI